MRFTGDVAKSFSARNQAGQSVDPARSMQYMGEARKLVGMLVERINGPGLNGYGSMSDRRFMADGTLIRAYVRMIPGTLPIIRTWIESPVGGGRKLTTQLYAVAFMPIYLDSITIDSSDGFSADLRAFGKPFGEDVEDKQLGTEYPFTQYGRDSLFVHSREINQESGAWVGRISKKSASWNRGVASNLGAQNWRSKDQRNVLSWVGPLTRCFSYHERLFGRHLFFRLTTALFFADDTFRVLGAALCEVEYQTYKGLVLRVAAGITHETNPRMFSFIQTFEMFVTVTDERISITGGFEVIDTFTPTNLILQSGFYFNTSGSSAVAVFKGAEDLFGNVYLVTWDTEAGFTNSVEYEYEGAVGSSVTETTSMNGTSSYGLVANPSGAGSCSGSVSASVTRVDTQQTTYFSREKLLCADFKNDELVKAFHVSPSGEQNNTQTFSVSGSSEDGYFNGITYGCDVVPFFGEGTNHTISYTARTGHRFFTEKEENEEEDEDEEEKYEVIDIQLSASEGTYTSRFSFAAQIQFSASSKWLEPEGVLAITWGPDNATRTETTGQSAVSTAAIAFVDLRESAFVVHERVAQMQESSANTSTTIDDYARFMGRLDPVSDNKYNTQERSVSVPMTISLNKSTGFGPYETTNTTDNFGILECDIETTNGSVDGNNKMFVSASVFSLDDELVYSFGIIKPENEWNPYGGPLDSQIIHIDNVLDDTQPQTSWFKRDKQNYLLHMLSPI